MVFIDMQQNWTIWYLSIFCIFLKIILPPNISFLEILKKNLAYLAMRKISRKGKQKIERTLFMWMD